MIFSTCYEYLDFFFFFFFNDTATTEIYTLSLHDALPDSGRVREPISGHGTGPVLACPDNPAPARPAHHLKGHGHLCNLAAPCPPAGISPPSTEPDQGASTSSSTTPTGTATASPPTPTTGRPSTCTPPASSAPRGCAPAGNHPSPRSCGGADCAWPTSTAPT